MYGPEIATMPGNSKIAEGKQLREIRIRKLDDGTFVLCAEYEGRTKDGMHSYERKESSYKNPRELADALVTNFLKANITSREQKQEKNLKAREG